MESRWKVYICIYLFCLLILTGSMKVTSIGDKMALNIEKMYGKSTQIRCPFWRRRVADVLDASSLMLSFLLARHKSLSGPWYPPGCASTGEQKTYGLDVEQIANIILQDWQPGSGRVGKGYYITGKLSKEIYKDDCFFDGPDPDMPVRGLRKYLSASSQLFDQRLSRADLISIGFNIPDRLVFVEWRIEGILNLPWHPRLKPWTGKTTYHINSAGLISDHIEEWNISVLDAFLSTLLPESLYKGSTPAAPIAARAARVTTNCTTS